MNNIAAKFTISTIIAFVICAPIFNIVFTENITIGEHPQYLSQDCGITWKDLKSLPNKSAHKSMTSGAMIYEVTLRPKSLSDIFHSEKGCIILAEYFPYGELNVAHKKVLNFKDGYDADVRVEGRLKIIDFNKAISKRMAAIKDKDNWSHFNEDHGWIIKDLTVNSVYENIKWNGIDKAVIDEASRTDVTKSSEVKFRDNLIQNASIFNGFDAYGLALDPASIKVTIQLTRHTKELLHGDFKERN